MVTRLLIARHGNTFAPGEIVTRVGITDLNLSESGLKQGLLLGNWLKSNHLVPDVIFTSNLQRTIQTASQAQVAMNTTLPTSSLSIFNEINYGPDENIDEEKVLARIGKDALHAWESDAKVPDGWLVDPALIIHNWQCFALQLKKEHQGKNILVITSNGIARFAPYLTGDFEAFRAKHAIKITTGAVCLFETSNDEPYWTCLKWNTKPISFER